MRHRILILFPLLGLLLAVAALAEDSFVELLRRDLRADLTDLVDDAMELNEAQEDLFWPIYREYEEETVELGDRRMEMIRRFGEAGERMPEATARELAEEWFAQQQERLDIRKRTFERLSEAISPSVAARFIQVENQLGLMVDLQLASEAPLIRGESE